MLKSDYIEKYEIINKQLEMQVTKAKRANREVKKEFKEQEGLYKSLQNEVEINEYNGETNNVTILSLRLVGRQDHQLQTQPQVDQIGNRHHQQTVPEHQEENQGQRLLRE